MMMSDAEIAHLELNDAELAGVFGGMAEARCANEMAAEESVMM